MQTLFEQTTNEMPATKDMLLKTVTELCRLGDLEKIGQGDEKRRPTTDAQLEDIVRPRGQRHFSFFRDPKPR